MSRRGHLCDGKHKHIATSTLIKDKALRVGCEDVAGFDANNLNSWFTSRVAVMNGMFEGAKSIRNASGCSSMWRLSRWSYWAAKVWLRIHCPTTQTCSKRLCPNS